jgi:hypothetical protein
MAAPQPAATTQPATSAPALGDPRPSAAVAVADPGHFSREPNSRIERASESAGQAAFNPFATVGTVVQQHAPPTPVPQPGDLSLPLLAAVVGAVYIGRLLRRMVQ